ncbi:MAG: hypothetical protein CMH52_00020 [Myxococcales bacterium]|nr:hypothetical protein [Myxococcales bacterium]|tara:strand:- start:1729 stop:3204 length:1476 start_codon:yes stop_codon:yes gene_type:complete
MSNYKSTKPNQIVSYLRREGLIRPLPGEPHFLSEEHDLIEAELNRYRNSLVHQYNIPIGLVERWHSVFDGLARFTALTHQTYWEKVYGTALTSSVCNAVFGQNLRIELYRSRSTRRRIMLMGHGGAGRAGIGDRIRQLTVECLVRANQMGDPKGVSRSVRLSTGHDDIATDVFGGRRYGTTEQVAGCLADCNASVLFLDEALQMPDNLQPRFLAALDTDSAGYMAHQNQASNLHLITGVQGEFERDNYEQTSVIRALFESLCRDGLIEIPAFNTLISEVDDWLRIFSIVYQNVARSYCGLSSISLHQYGARSDEFIPDDVAADVIADEQTAFMTWITDSVRVERIARCTWLSFQDYDWSGNLRELEALIRSLINVQISGPLELHVIEEQCQRFLRRGNRSQEHVSRESSWLLNFDSALHTLPLSDETLPTVISQVEATYFRLAAERAAKVRHPGHARLQDVARLLGIPRQTAARKWKQYGLPPSLLSTDSH